MTLDIDRFDEFFVAMWGVAPYDWQRRLARRVHTDGAWPSALDLPTGTGKTSALDVAVFTLALDALRPPAHQTLPRRTVMVVDRRTIVDQGYDRAQTIAEKLSAAETGILVEVAAALRSLGGLPRGEPPVTAALLRGATRRDESWARRPDTAVLAVSTVDQVGSRLLFRGYGLSDSARPIHAGLLGNDTLLLLDEVHLSEPFRQTLEALGRRFRPTNGLPNRWGVVRLSATPRSPDPEAFTLTATDTADARLAMRLQAKRPTALGDVLRADALPAALTKAARKFARPGRTVGIVVNRVDTALATFKALREVLDPNTQLFLVTGRMRPLDRDALVQRLGPFVAPERKPDPTRAPCIVVATQCIEAGADYDFDALICECASFDAVRQRFGRLNRTGMRDAEALIVARKESLDPKKPDPIYGNAIALTWAWLRENHQDLDLATVAAPPDPLALAPAPDAPILLRSHLDAWCQTSPRPDPDPDVSLWLHGPERGVPQVSVVWRADIDFDQANEGPTEAITAQLSTVPPSTLEAVNIPLYAARAWLAGNGVAPIGDVEAGSVDDDADQSSGNALRWNDDKCERVALDDLRPGDTVIVPATFGGLCEGSFDPTTSEPVEDLGDLAQAEHRGWLGLRLDARVLANATGTPVPVATEDDESYDQALQAWLANLAGATSMPWVGSIAGRLAKAQPRRFNWDVVAGNVYVHDRRRLQPREWIRGHGLREDEPTTDGDRGSFTGRAIELFVHLDGVGAMAGAFAERSGLSPDLVHDIALAGRWHDLGKADPRFQTMLHGGDPIAAGGGVLLAKSGVEPNSPAGKRARQRAGVYAGFRHELVSEALLRESPEVLDLAKDRDLVLHLVASHHGACRPFAPAVDDPAPRRVEVASDGRAIVGGSEAVRMSASSGHNLARLDSDVSDRYWRLVDRYGWHGVAWLEALLRLADHRRSAIEQEEAQ